MGKNPAAWQFGIGDATPAGVKTDRGTLLVKDLKIFKAATFKDSRGRQRTWKPKDLQDMVGNFDLLRTEGLFTAPPVRADHSISVDKVKGYIQSVRSDGQFLYADVEFTEPDGIEKYERGTYRNRSIEVGPYETNGADPKTHFPCVLGLAFVDIPAVEGLFSRQRDDNEENEVPELATFRVRGVPTTDADAVQGHIDTLEKAPAPAAHNFRVSGTDEADFAKVQAHIDALETFQSEQMTAGRDAFVDSLVEKKLVLAPKAADLKTFARSLPSDAFDAWCKTYADAPALFTKVTGSGDGGQGDANDEIEVLRATVNMHRRSGMNIEAVKVTESYRKLVAASPSDAIA